MFWVAIVSSAHWLHLFLVRRDRRLPSFNLTSLLWILERSRTTCSSKIKFKFVDEMELENLNVTLAEGRVTWNAREHESAIDYMLVNGRMREIVSHMWIDEDGMVDIV
ncbi:hypothetical protein E2C01_027301 [Portunus trituberculatus]|uniref:Uncharacterized protein n=1 Tax=Portunus trituberculatus TaxID=210409 RepID=A0A5B7EID5_PORTR|nr:hypothetical protein [Portunus trituberculatus]